MRSGRPEQAETSNQAIQHRELFKKLSSEE